MMHTSKSMLIIAVLVTLSIAGMAQAQTTWYVDDDCAPPGSGTPGDPFCTIQNGLDAAQNGDTVEVAGGTYTGPGNKELDFLGRTVTVRSTDPSDPEVVSSTVIDCQYDGRAFHFQSGEPREAVLDGLTIINGRRQDLFGTGGGIRIVDSSPTIRRCVISHCDVNWQGAGVHLINSDALLENCIIEHNVSDGGSGGVLWSAGNAELRGCILRNNRATAVAGANLIDLDSAKLIDCLVTGNVTTGTPGNVGGVHFAGTNIPRLLVDVRNCTIVDNHAKGEGGGIKFYYHQDSLVTNSIIWGNTASVGPQIHLDDNPHPTNPVRVRVQYSDVQGGSADVYVGLRNVLQWYSSDIDSDPLFTPGPAGCFYLSQTAAGQPANSLCVDAGDDTAVNLGLDVMTTRSDEIGDAGVVDMGYHYAVTGSPLIMGDFEPDADVDLSDYAAFLLALNP